MVPLIGMSLIYILVPLLAPNRPVFWIVVTLQILIAIFVVTSLGSTVVIAEPPGSMFVGPFAALVGLPAIAVAWLKLSKLPNKAGVLEEKRRYDVARLQAERLRNGER